MKTILFRTSLVGMLAASAFHAQTPSSLDRSASSNPGAGVKASPRYNVTDLGTFGGTFSIAFGINNAGRVAGTAALPSGHTHAFVTGLENPDLGTLGGPNAQASRPNGRGDVPIVSETSSPDPLKEDFCGFGNRLVCLGALWSGVLTPLRTLGGNNAMALALNNRGEVIGVAENGQHDPSCPAPQVLGFEAVVWGPKPGEIHGLPPLRGDTVGFALGINDRGQIVGSSGSCANTVVTAVGLFIGQHPVLWENEKAMNLGSLGGTMGKAAAINNRGEVAGFSSLSGDASVSAFLWTRETGMQKLGALGTDLLGDPTGINNKTQVVGGSCVDISSQNCSAFFWEKNTMSNLNDLIPQPSPLYLVYAFGINDAGEVVGFAVQQSTGDVHAYLATPIHGEEGSASAPPTAQGVTSESGQVALPDSVRMLLQQRLPFGRFGARQVGPR